MALFRRARSLCCGAVFFLSVNCGQISTANAYEPVLLPNVDIFSNYESGRPAFGVGVFAPLLQNGSSFVFLDGSLSASDTAFNAASIGIGYRIQRSWGVLGINGFLDLSQPVYSDIQTQIGLGLEVATGRFRLGVNGYLPLDDKETALGASEAVIVGNELLIFGGEEHFLKGVELELGILAGQFDTGQFSAQLWTHGKLASFYSDELGSQNSAQIGFEAVIKPFSSVLSNSEIRFGAGASWDEDNDFGLTASFKMSMALGRRTSASHSDHGAAYDLLSNRVSRRLGVYSKGSATGASELTYDHDTNVALNTVYQVDNQLDLDAALLNSNSLTIVDGSSTTYTPIKLRGDRTVMGGGSTILVRGRDTGQVVAFTAAGARPTIKVITNPLTTTTYSRTGADITGNNSHIAGFKFVGTGGFTLFFGVGVGIGSNVSNTVIEQNTFDNFPAAITISPFGRDHIIRANHIERSYIGVNLGSSLLNVLIEDNQIGNLDLLFGSKGDAIHIPSGANVSSAAEPITIQNNYFFGIISGAIIDVSSGGYALAGSGNSSSALNGSGVSAVSAFLCTTNGLAFSGTVGFKGGAVQYLSTTQCY